MFSLANKTATSKILSSAFGMDRLYTKEDDSILGGLLGVAVSVLGMKWNDRKFESGHFLRWCIFWEIHLNSIFGSQRVEKSLKE